MRCAIWYHLYNLKNVKNTHGGVLLFTSKSVLLKISQISQENTCVGVSFKKYPPVNYAKFLRTTFFIEHLQWLLLKGTDDTIILNLRVFQTFRKVTRTVVTKPGQQEDSETPIQFRLT